MFYDNVLTLENWDDSMLSKWNGLMSLNQNFLELWNTDSQLQFGEKFH